MSKYKIRPVYSQVNQIIQWVIYKREWVMLFPNWEYIDTRYTKESAEELIKMLRDNGL